MTSSPAAPPLDDAARRVVEQARRLLGDLLDGLRPELLAATGATGVEMKADGTPVTRWDLEVSERLAARVGRDLPAHAVLSEEHDTTFHGDEWTWIVDPVDGTSNFTTGVPYWCVSVAVAFRGWPVLGVVDAPPIGARFEAVRGEGATRNGAPIGVAPAADPDDPGNRHVPLFLSTMTARRVQPRVRLNPRVLGSAALDVCLVAAGTGAAAISMTPKVWDHAAAALLVEEAGGAYVHLGREPLLPLVAGREYAGRSAPGGAGPDEAYVRRLTERLTTVEEDLARH